jgi:hypothetical protein
MRASDCDQTLKTLMRDVSDAQAALHTYLDTGKAPRQRVALVDPNLVRLAEARALMPHWSDDTMRRKVKQQRLGRQIGRLWFVDLAKFERYIARHAERSGQAK